MSRSADERPPCGVCEPNVSGFQFCRHLVDPESRLYLLLTKAKNWNHFKAMEALDAYADFLTLKVLEEDYDGTLLMPTEGLEPLNALRTDRIPHIQEAYPGRSRASVFFVGPADVARRALPDDIRRTTQIFVRNFASSPYQTLVFRVDLSEHGDFVIELKWMVHERLGIPPQFQWTECQGKLLDDHRRLYDCGVLKESSLSVSVRWC
jgi:hypothetical protein